MLSVDFEHDFAYEKKLVRTLSIIQAAGIVITIILFFIFPASWPASVMAILVIAATFFCGFLLYSRYQSLPVVTRKKKLNEQKDLLDQQILDNKKKHDDAGIHRQQIEQFEKDASNKRLSVFENLEKQLNGQTAKADSDKRQELSSTLRKIQNDYFVSGLRSFSIINSNIPNVGPKLRERLVANSVATAYDVEASRILSISGFGEAKVNSIVAWRKGIEAQLNAKMPSRLPDDTEKSFVEKYANIKAQISTEQSLAQAQLEADLSAIRNEAKQKHAKNDASQREAKLLLSTLNEDLKKLSAELAAFGVIQPWNYLRMCFLSVSSAVDFRKPFVALGLAAILFLGMVSQLVLGAGSTAAMIVNSIPTSTPTPTQTDTPTSTYTFTPTATYTATMTPTDTLTPTITDTPTATLTASVTPTATKLPTSTRQPTAIVVPVLPTRVQSANPTAVPAQGNGNPTAKCKDGSLSYSQNRQGTCSHHGGVAVWY
jgi:hypothetical protein